ncbi:hypothetical protein ACR6C2_29390 [Streptomyces sp. INA 01156]
MAGRHRCRSGEGRTPSAESSAPPPHADDPAVRETFAELVPDRVEVVSKGGQGSEYAYLVLDDGKGKSFVQVNVQPDTFDVAHQLYGSAETLDDGTMVATRQGPGDGRSAGSSCGPSTPCGPTAGAW